jgi:hypothetical protein
MPACEYGGAPDAKSTRWPWESKSPHRGHDAHVSERARQRGRARPHHLVRQAGEIQRDLDHFLAY